MSELKIKSYETHVLGTPWRNITYLILTTEEGLTGVGESRVVGRTHSVIELLKDTERHFIGKSAHDIEALYERFTLDDFNVPGSEAITAYSLVEMACLDLKAKSMNVPVYQLLGGKLRDKITAYANGWYTVEREPVQFAAAAKKVTKDGYKALKFDPFGKGNLELTRAEFNKSLDLIVAVHEAIPKDTQILLEMHGRFAPHQALEIANAVYDLGIRPGWIEEPCRPTDLQGHAFIRSKSKIPVATGERLYTPKDYKELFEKDTADIIQIDPTNFGVWQAMKLIQTAETHSKMIAPHNVGGVISTLAGIHLATACRPFKILEHFNDYADKHVKQAADWYPEVINGEFQVPNKPGWGVTLNLDFIKANPPAMNDSIILDPGLNMFKKDNWHEREQKQ